MPTDYRSGYKNYSASDRAQKVAAGYRGMGTDTLDSRIKYYGVRKMKEDMATMGLAPDDPMIETVKEAQKSPKDI